MCQVVRQNTIGFLHTTRPAPSSTITSLYPDTESIKATAEVCKSKGRRQATGARDTIMRARARRDQESTQESTCAELLTYRGALLARDDHGSSM